MIPLSSLSFPISIFCDSLFKSPIYNSYQGMQFYRFIFLARSWAADKTYLGQHLSFMTARSRQTSPSGPSSSLPKLLLLIFPEGTLISENTQPISRKYAEKNGLEDRTNVLLPRSTGLLFCLRALRREVDDLKLVVSF